MENKSLFTQGFLKISHLPTVILLIGYPVYWLELYFLNSRKGGASLLAPITLLFIAALILIRNWKSIYVFCLWFKRNLFKQDFLVKWYIYIGLFIILMMLAIVFYAALLPPHLSQELDVINYHLTVPRQHLILGSFAHIKWSSADLFLLPVDFSLAPYWFVTELPNKMPQFLFLLGLILVSVSLVRRFSGANFSSICLIIFAIFGSHFIGIQMGTGMLDIIACYLFIAALDSFLNKNILSATAEFAFFLWSKSFIPLQISFIAISGIALWGLLKISGFKELKWGFEEPIAVNTKRSYLSALRRAVIPFILFSIIIAGPFLLKSTYYSGTPLFPFAPGCINVNKNIDRTSDAWDSVLISSRAHISTRDSYGHGRSLLAFLKHFWLIAVPEKNVNNSYDYPVGLMYLLFLGPFLYMLFYSMKKRQFSILAAFIMIYWLTWWFGSQQSRFLYIPILLMMIIISSKLRIQSRIFMLAVIASLILTGLSIFRAHKNDFGKSRIDILRRKDREITQLNKYYSEKKETDTVRLKYFDVAYACFPVMVTDNNSRWVLRVDE